LPRRRSRASLRSRAFYCSTRAHHFHQEASDASFRRCRCEGAQRGALPSLMLIGTIPTFTCPELVSHGSNPVPWASRTQRNTERSAGESEFISLSRYAQEPQCMRLLKASMPRSFTVPSATVRANDDAEHAAHSFKRELELDAATVCTDSAATRQSLSRKRTSPRRNCFPLYSRSSSP